MSRTIIIRDEARFDVIDIAYHIAEDSLASADRFAEAIDAAYKQLAAMPGMGALRDYNNPKLKGLRMWPVPGFRNHLIFYLASDDKLEIVRVVHGAQDLESLFAPEPEEENQEENS